MSAAVLDLGDSVKTLIQNYITVNEIQNVTVERVYQATHDLGKLTGRKIDIFPLSYVSPEDVDRANAFYDLSYAVVVLERYTQTGDIPKAWIDNLVTYVQNGIFNVFDQPYMLISNVQYVPTVSVPTVYDYDILKANRVFWSEINITFRRIATGL